jgi:hypothetical protein
MQFVVKTPAHGESPSGGGLTFNVPEYVQAERHLLGKVMLGLTGLDPLLGQMPWIQTEHAGPVRNVPGPEPLDQEMLPVEATAAFSKEAVRDSRLDEFVAFVVELTEQSQKQMAIHTFQRMGELTEATGNTVDAGGKPLSYDVFLDLLERMQLEFDEKGDPILPTVWGHPATIERFKALQPTPEHSAREAAILARKKAEFDAAKRTRRLS